MTTIAKQVTEAIERTANVTLGSCERRWEMKYLALAALLAFLMAPMAVGCKKAEEPAPEEAAPVVEEAAEEAAETAEEVAEEAKEIAEEAKEIAEDADADWDAE
jgi:hypothetical protein